jgi:hypothetical protein
MMTATCLGATLRRMGSRARRTRPAPSITQRKDLQMADDVSQYRATGGAARETSGWAVGFILFAALMMIMSGFFQLFAGLIAIVNNDFYVATRDYIFQFDATTWGWIQLLWGVIVVLAGFGLMAGQTWARVVGIFLAVLSAIANFLFIPYYPIWALTVIALDVFVIWALAVHGGEMRETRY